MYGQQFKENLYSLFLPIFMAIFIAVPVAVATSFFLLRADRAQAENNTQSGNTSVTASGLVACVEPGGSSASVGGYSVAAAALFGFPSTGDVTNNNTENYAYNYDSYNSGSYNKTMSWEDNDTKTITISKKKVNIQSWEDNDSNAQVFDSSNQNNPVTSTNTVVSTVTSNAQSFSDDDSNSNTQTFEDNDTTTTVVEDNDVTVVEDNDVVAPQDNDATVTTTTVEDNDGIDIL